MDTVGCFGRSVRDVAIGLDAIAGSDVRDPFTTSLRHPPVGEYRRSLSTDLLPRGGRFGLPNKRFWDLVTGERREVAIQLINAIEQADNAVRLVEIPCADERIDADGIWNWYTIDIFNSVFG